MPFHKKYGCIFHFGKPAVLFLYDQILISEVLTVQLNFQFTDLSQIRTQTVISPGVRFTQA